MRPIIAQATTNAKLLKMLLPVIMVGGAATIAVSAKVMNDRKKKRNAKSLVDLMDDGFGALDDLVFETLWGEKLERLELAAVGVALPSSECERVVANMPTPEVDSQEDDSADTTQNAEAAEPVKRAHPENSSEKSTKHKTKNAKQEILGPPI